MPPKIGNVTEAELRSRPMPLSTRTYSPIGHGEIIDMVKMQLVNQGFYTFAESYRASKDLDISIGTYNLIVNDSSLLDDEIGMMIAWRNSYDKTASFKCGIGGKVLVCDNGMISSDMSAIRKVHRGNIRTAVQSYISDEIAKAAKNMRELFQFRDEAKQVMLYKKDKALILGDIFLNYNMLTSNQFSVVKRELENASYTYNAHANSAWVLYNHITHALKESHPIRYLEDHKDVYEYFVKEVLSQKIPFTAPQQEEIKEEVIEKIEQEFQVSNTFGVIF